MSTPSYEEWLESQPPEIQEQLTAQQADLQAMQAKLVELEQQALQAGSEAAETKAQNAFFEAASQAGVTKLRLAYMAAREAGLVGEDGTADPAALRRAFPELFGAASGPGKAGQGSGALPPATLDMNGWIRRAAGRG